MDNDEWQARRKKAKKKGSEHYAKEVSRIMGETDREIQSICENAGIDDEKIQALVSVVK